MKTLNAKTLVILTTIFSFTLASGLMAQEESAKEGKEKTKTEETGKTKAKKVKKGKKGETKPDEKAPAEGETPAPGEGSEAAGTGGTAGTGEAAGTGEGTEGAAPKKEGELTEAEIIQKAGSYSVQLRDLEQKVNQLKEKIFRSKARLSLLAEKVLSGPAGAGARATITYSDKMGSSFKLVKAVFILDGVPIYNKADEKGLKKKAGLQLFTAPIVPGEHTLSVNVEYKGNGYGLFAYLNDYRFKVRSSHAFTVDEGKSKDLQVVIYEKGNIATPLEERPAIKYVEQGGDFSQ